MVLTTSVRRRKVQPKTGLFSLSYWGPISYYADILRYESIVFEIHESFLKQSYHNRAYIDGPNGPLMLNLAIDHNTKGWIRETRISDNHNWRNQHWQALQTTYNNSPFFDALSPEIEELYQEVSDSLYDLNLRSTKLIFKWLRIDAEWHLSESWQKEAEDMADQRGQYNPKKRAEPKQSPYPQVFDHKHGFNPELSILDLIFNEGPAAYDYLRQL